MVAQDMKQGKPKVQFISGGARLHIQHGPIDLILGADGDRFGAFVAGQSGFDTVLQSLVDELDMLRLPFERDMPEPVGDTACRMHAAALPFCDQFLTRMICVAGAVADTVLHEMIKDRNLMRASVNNGGDIALHLSPEATFSMAIADHTGARLGVLELCHEDGVGGVATSAYQGRSLSLGIADAVTVLAKDAATADAAATLIANEVNIPDHPKIERSAACEIDPSSDLGATQVVTRCGNLTEKETGMALDRGLAKATEFLQSGKIIDAALFLQGNSRVLGKGRLTPVLPKRIQEYA